MEEGTALEVVLSATELVGYAGGVEMEDEVDELELELEYRGQAVLVGLHLVMVTVAVRYEVAVVVPAEEVTDSTGYDCATAEAAPAANTISDEICILNCAFLWLSMLIEKWVSRF